MFQLDNGNSNSYVIRTHSKSWISCSSNFQVAKQINFRVRFWVLKYRNSIANLESHGGPQLILNFQSIRSKVRLGLQLFMSIQSKIRICFLQSIESTDLYRFHYCKEFSEIRNEVRFDWANAWDTERGFLASGLSFSMEQEEKEDREHKSDIRQGARGTWDLTHVRL